jgi:hypothetical protein
MPSKILSIPFVLLAAWNLYHAFTGGELNLVGMVLPVVALAVIYVLNPQVDWFWYSRFPPDLPSGLVRMLEASTGPYRGYSEEEKTDFRKKTALFRLNLSFKGPAFDDTIPEDLQILVAATAVQLTRLREKFLFPDFQVAVLYPGPFPSPRYPTLFHASELHEEDGVLLFSAEHLVRGFMEPGRYYDVGLHEWAHAFIRSHPNLHWPEPDEVAWELLAQVSGFRRAVLQGYVNRPDLELLPAMIVHYVHFAPAFESILPEYARYFKLIFGK